MAFPEGYPSILQLILGIILLLSGLGVVLARKPVYAGLSFLLTLVTLSILYIQLAAPFIATMQILVYAGAILVIFMFVIVLFQDAYLQMAYIKPQSYPLLLFIAAALFAVAMAVMGKELLGTVTSYARLPSDYGSVQALGKALYLDFFFPFEAVIVLFLVAVVGALYIGKKSEN